MPSDTPSQPPQGAARIAGEADLVARTLAGERAAFGVLVERYAPQARRVARAVLGDADEADDAAQDGFLSALVKLAQYDARRPFGPWLMRIVANAATDRRRRRQVRRVEPPDPGLLGGGPRPPTGAGRGELGGHPPAGPAGGAPRPGTPEGWFSCAGRCRRRVRRAARSSAGARWS